MTGKLGKIFIISILLLLLGAMILDYFNHTYIKAEFNKTDPMPAKMGVYYKGYRLGTTNKLRISKDFKTTYLYIALNQRGLHLPKNISVEVKNYDDDIKYVDIVYPSAPMIKYIKSGDVIKGKYELSADGISSANQAHLDTLSAKGEMFLNSATKTTDALTDLFGLIYDMLDENRSNLLNSSNSLKNSMDNLEISTTNFKEFSQKINEEISREGIRKSSKNIEVVTSNLADSSKNFSLLSGNFNKTSSDFNVLIPKLSLLIDIAQSVMCNLNEITSGLGETLRKRFGGARIIFGKPIK